MLVEGDDIFALVVAAGRGLRTGGKVPKQYALLAGKPVLRRTLQTIMSQRSISGILVVIGADDGELYKNSVTGLPTTLPPVIGGATRQLSVRNGLEALAEHRPRLVLIHDAARPLVSGELISRVVEACTEEMGAIPAMSVTETLKRIEGAYIAGTVPRDDLVTAQTPQGFPFQRLLEAHRKAAEAGRDDLTDDAAVAALAGLPVRVVEGDRGNLKITTPADFRAAERLLEQSFETRAAQGFDVHAFGPGDSLWLCGVRLPHSQGLVGHSDADVGLHALTDALLGTIGDGDIGAHFPPTDPQWKGAASHLFLRDAVRRVGERGGRIRHLDVTIICERPKIGPYRESMRQTVAETAGLTIGRVSVKATTSEGLGFTGRGEGIAALALATVELPI